MDYFKKEWVNKLPLWVKGSLAGVDHSNAYTNAAIEAYHKVLKDLHLKGRKRLSGRRLDWLITCLMTTAIKHYRCAAYVYYAWHGRARWAAAAQRAEGGGGE